MNTRRVVVTGIGAITPIGKTTDETWKNMINGVSGAAPITRFDATNFKTQFACEVKDYKPTDYFDRKEVRKYDQYAQFALISAAEAVKNSGLDLDSIDKDRAGVVWGSGIGGLDTFISEISEWATGDKTPRFGPFFIPKMIVNMASGLIAIQHGFSGLNFTCVSACASSSHAMLDAMNHIKWNKADIIITGGSEAAINEAGVGGFNSMKAISTRNDDPKTGSRPFDADRDGFVLAEGGVALVFEEYEHAIKRGATILAEVAGGAMNCDAYHMTAPDPEGRKASNVMTLAIKDAGLKPEDIDYVNVHGTSTGLGDIAEPKALINTFGEHVYKMSVSSTKSMTGHMLGAAGAVEALACINAIQNGIVPPTINLHNLDPEVDSKIDFTFNKAKKRDIKAALSNNFGFGGHNACVIFKKI
ncbi:MAG: beta-ketoacyl-ACP synthase II [Salinivirgaceae bacterium]|nr:beta-ketoacyl-ACP synthase II [Salinivirgaceae bacterium]MDD4746466.1 beta-ketoacyl-ACP synthase II [Salinivirgaceae bacterium]MDY0281432.1 beta-ketoacyl-ACP synthase II [Salinivirgaceae bacterium]